ncbi:hypothetical protein [Mycobacterium noviomagense]|uniref:hypothetical protein n=1 Tax=Mycobacterium noviomagense TaxID=459858 RepID=UPI001E46DBDF|nr:hypothetical protein [Mycobacterium noviomagense]
MTGRTKTCSEVIRLGRLKKAIQFLDAALYIEDETPDASGTLLFSRASLRRTLYVARLGK